MAVPRSSSSDDIENEDVDLPNSGDEPPRSPAFDTKLFNEYKILRAAEKTLLVCPYDSASATRELPASTAIYTLKTTHQFQKGPALSIFAASGPSSSQTSSTSNAPTLGVAHLGHHRAQLGLGDPAVEVGQDAIAWETLVKNSKWSHSVYSFEVSLPRAGTGAGGGKGNEERRRFEWRRLKLLRMEMELVEVGEGKDEGLVLAHYVRSSPMRRRREKGVVSFRKESHVEGTRLGVVAILSALSLDEMKRRRDR